MDRHRYLSAACGVGVLLWVAAAHALINPRFTPVHLVKQSSLILSADVKQGATKEQYTLTILEALKGKTHKKSFQLDLTKARDEANTENLRALAAAGKPALFFVGEFEGAEGQSRGLLHISGKWASCVGGRDGVWLFDNVDPQHQAVWAGGTDMLRRVVDYILTDGDPAVPVAAHRADSRAVDRFAVELARAGKLGKLLSLHGQIEWHGTSIAGPRTMEPDLPEPPREEFDWDLFLGPTAWQPYKRTYRQEGGVGNSVVGHGILNMGTHWMDLCQWANDTELTDRLLASIVEPERHPEHRWRGMRTAPKGIGP